MPPANPARLSVSQAGSLPYRRLLIGRAWNLSNFRRLPTGDTADYQSALLRLELREENHVADALLAQQHHAEPVNAQPHAAGRRHAVFQRHEKIFVQLLLLSAGLMLEPVALMDRIILFSVSGGDFLAVDAAFEDLDRGRVFG